jgi:hypothetical protein
MGHTRLLSGCANFGTVSGCPLTTKAVRFACMGEVSLAIALVRHVLDWARGCHACSTGAQPYLVGLLITPTGVHFYFNWERMPPKICNSMVVGTAALIDDCPATKARNAAVQ